MIRRAAILIGVPVLLALLAAVPLAMWRGEYQWLCAGVAVVLVVPPGLVTLVLAERLAKASLFGPLIALAVGTAVRVAVGFGGSALVFFLSEPTFHADPVSYFGWVLAVYLTTLITETVLLAGKRTAGVGSQ